MKKHRKYGYRHSQTVMTTTALCGLLIAAVVLPFPLWKATGLQIGNAAWIHFNRSAPGHSHSAQSVLSLRRDLLGLAWTRPVTADRWFASPPVYQSPKSDSADDEGRILPADIGQSSQDLNVIADSDQLPGAKSQILHNFVIPLDEGTHTLDLSSAKVVQSGPPPQQNISSIVRTAQFSTVNVLGAQEWLNRKVVALDPGQSAYLYASAFSEGLHPQWENELTLVVIALGATADRVDAPGKLSFEPIEVPRPATRRDQKNESHGAEKESKGPSRSNKSRTLLYTVPEDPATHFAISHVPQVEDLNLNDLVNPQHSPDALRITWSAQSSGTLLILGIRKSPAPQATDHTPPGFLLISADELAHPEPSLPQTRSQLQKLAGPSKVVELHEVWPAHPHELENHLALLGQSAANQSPFADKLSEFGRQNYRGVIRVDLIANSAPLPPQAQLATVADARVIIEADQWGRTPLETTAQIASLVATGFLVHLHIWWKPDVLPLSNISWQTHAAHLLHGQMSARLASTILAGPDAPSLLRNREIFSRMDAFEAELLRLLPDHPQPTVLLHIARQPNALKRDIVRLTENVPLDYAPGYAAVLPGERWWPEFAEGKRGRQKSLRKSKRAQSSPPLGDERQHEESAIRSFPVESPTTQDRVLSALLLGLTRQDPSKVSTSGGLVRSAERGSETLAWRSRGREGDSAGLVAAVEGAPGTLFVFDRGWIFVPGWKAPGSSNPVYGVPLEDLVEARQSIYTHLNQDPIRLVSVDIRKSDDSELQLEWRSEYPFSACSASALATTISQKVSDSEGWMQVKVSVPPGESRVLATCVINLSQKNPIRLKQRNEENETNSARENEAETLPGQLALRVIESGKKLPLANFVFGPYRERGESLSLSKSGIELNLEKQTERLMKITAPARTEGSLKEAAEASGTQAWLYVSPGRQLPQDHPVKEDWETLVRAFVRERQELATQLRASRL